MSASKAKRAEVAERRKNAIQMVLAGLDYETIAERLGYASRGAAHTDVTRALTANLADLKKEAGTLREVQARRYQRLLAAVWPKALKGDLKAVETAARLTDRVVKLYGLAEPDRLDLDVTGQVTAEDLMEIIRNAPAGDDLDADA
ncbi:hypothetical protein [Streptomyces sp. NBC_01233]|uniref:hypothetical protein n=1 Tax=Streptomyces sp. NBC_01233 TaxID=2903787 RepID=UPI002E0E414F|nr:hypothetical protein OG332_24025 [Streptomyces sp. NBC_01233]